MIRKFLFAGVLGMLLGTTVVTGQSIPDTWKHQYTFPDSVEVRSVTFTDSLHGWAVGEIYGVAAILCTQDAGRSWRLQVKGEGSTTWLNDIAITPDSTGWAVGYGPSYQTSDGGVSWTEIPLEDFNCEEYVGDLQDVDLFSANQGILVGQMNTVITTGDAGETWDCFTLVLEDGFIDTIHTARYLTAEKLIVTGMGGFAHSQDSGATWHMNYSAWENFHASTTVSPRFAWTISRKGHLFRSRDAGLNWTDLGYVYSEEYVSVRGIAFHDSLVGWVCTSEGTIWETNDGGETWEGIAITPNVEMVTVGSVYRQIAYAANAKGKLYIRRSPVTGVRSTHTPALPNHAQLFPAYPNPFNGSVTITFRVPESQDITLAVYNISGGLVEILADGYRDAGEYSFRWNPVKRGSGIYLITLETGRHSVVQRVIYLK